MLRHCRPLVLACSSLTKQFGLRGLSASNVVRAEEIPKEDVDDLFSDNEQPNDQNRPRRRTGVSMNRVDLIGGVAANPVMRTGKTGREFVTFTLITNNRYRRPSGEVVDSGSEAHMITVFNGTERAMQVIQKGKRMFVSGSLHYTTVTARDGGLMNRPSIKADIFQPLEVAKRTEGDNMYHDESH